MGPGRIFCPAFSFLAGSERHALAGNRNRLLTGVAPDDEHHSGGRLLERHMR